MKMSLTILAYFISKLPYTDAHELGEAVLKIYDDKFTAPQDDETKMTDSLVEWANGYLEQ